MFYHPDTTGTISTQCHASRTDARASVTAGYGPRSTVSKAAVRSVIFLFLFQFQTSVTVVICTYSYSYCFFSVSMSILVF